MMHDEKITSKSNSEEIIEWTRKNYYAQSVKSRQLLESLDTNDEAIIANKYNILGILDMYDSEYYQSQSNFLKALPIAQKRNDTLLQAKIYLNLTSVNERIENYPEAIRYASKVFSTGQSKLYGSTYVNLARINFMSGNLDIAYKFLDESEKAYTKHNDQGVFHSYFLKSEIQKDQGEYEKALESYKFILEFLKTTTLSSFRAATLNEIGHTYLVLNKPNKAIPFIKEGIEDAIKYNISRDETLGHLRLGECYSVLKDFKTADKHLGIFLDSENEREATGIYYRLANELRIKNYKESNDNRLSSAYDSYIDYLTNVEIHNNQQVHKKYLKSKDSEISDIRSKAEEIKNQNDELRYISKLLAHELKTPVRTIGSFNSLLINANAEIFNDESKEYSKFISSGSKEIYSKLDLTEKYLSLKIDKRSEMVSIGDLINEIHSKYYETNIILKLKGAINLESADMALLKKAFFILFENYLGLSEFKKLSLEINCKHKEKKIIITDNYGLSSTEENWKRNIFQIKNDKITEGFSFFTKIMNLHNGHINVNVQNKYLEITFDA